MGDKYCIFEDQLEEHMELHAIRCVDCNDKFETVDKLIEHENDGDCYLCGKYFDCKTNMEKHKKTEHEITSEEGSKVEEKSSETREVENRVDNDETTKIVVENSEPIVEIIKPETNNITTEKTVGYLPGVTTEETVVDKRGITTEVKVGDTPEITAEETVGDKHDNNTVTEQDKVNKIIEESLQNNNNVDLKPRLEELEEIMVDWIEYNFTEHKSEEEYLVAQEKMIKIQKEKQVSLEEWDTIWMMFAAKKLEESEEEIEEIEDENEVRKDSQNNVI